MSEKGLGRYNVKASLLSKEKFDLKMCPNDKADGLNVRSESLVKRAQIGKTFIQTIGGVNPTNFASITRSKDI